MSALAGEDRKAILPLEEGQWPMEVHPWSSSTVCWRSSAAPNPRNASMQLMAAGHSEDEVRGAWNFAQAAGYTQSSVETDVTPDQVSDSIRALMLSALRSMRGRILSLIESSMPGNSLGEVRRRLS